MARDGAKPKPTGKKSPETTDKPQSERFIETARKLGVDETGATFDDAFKKMIPPVPAADRRN